MINRYTGDPETMLVHKTGCESLKKDSATTRPMFDSIEHALAQGHKPAPDCFVNDLGSEIDIRNIGAKKRRQ